MLIFDSDWRTLTSARPQCSFQASQCYLHLAFLISQCWLSSPFFRAHTVKMWHCRVCVLLENLTTDPLLPRSLTSPFLFLQNVTARRLAIGRCRMSGDRDSFSAPHALCSPSLREYYCPLSWLRVSGQKAADCQVCLRSLGIIVL